MGSLLEAFLIPLLSWIPWRLGTVLRMLWKPLFASCGWVRFEPGTVCVGCSNMRFGRGVRIGRNCRLYAVDGGMLAIDCGSVLSPGVTVDASADGRIVIGSKVAVGPGTVLRASNHRFDLLDIPIMDQGHIPGTIVIEDDVWIGANAVLTPDVRIGRGAVIGAGAVVTHDIEPYAIAVGVPARVVETRKKAPEG